MENLIAAVIGLIIGLGAGFFFKREDVRRRSLEIEAENERKIREAEKKVHLIEKKSQQILSDAKDEAHKITEESKDKTRKKEQEIEKIEIRLEQKEKELDEKVEKVTKKKEILKEKEDELEEMKIEWQEKITEETAALEKVAKMKKEEALKMLLEKVEKRNEKDLIIKMKRFEENLKEQADEKAKNLIVQAVQKMAADTTQEATVTTVVIPSDEMKGRIIGREGRNINTFERLTGVDVIVDDTPGVITISGFDLLRRFIAKKSLEKLIEDGRIHPTRIEEVIKNITVEVDKMVKELGEKAIFETGVSGLPTEMAKILGRLRFRTSYGQNILKHSIEVAFLSEAIASEVGADSELAKRAGLLHDIGKAVSQEISGKHALIGAEIAKKFKLSDKLINIIEAHHEDVEMKSPEAFIIAAADAISASRPGARKETVETFLKRVKELENIGLNFDGVDKCYAIQAGREIRVIVNPEKISDLQAKKLSTDIARKIEEDMTYPGEIKVLTLRETRSEGIAK